MPGIRVKGRVRVEKANGLTLPWLGPYRDHTTLRLGSGWRKLGLRSGSGVRVRLGVEKGRVRVRVWGHQGLGSGAIKD